jgi:RNA polymerase sigma-70 factor (ECF subfamily)
LLEPLARLEELQSYQPFFAARADLHRRVGRLEAARDDYERALSLAKNEPEKRFVARRMAEVAVLLTRAGG